MSTHETKPNIIPAIEARPLRTMPIPAEFSLDGPSGVWLGVGLVFVVTVLFLAILAFTIYLIGVIY